MRDGPVPRWLRFVLISDRAGSSWYVGTGFFFAPVLAIVSPWPTMTAILWVLIAVAGLWLGILGIAMATGLAMLLRAGTEIPEEYWWSLLGDPPSPRLLTDRENSRQAQMQPLTLTRRPTFAHTLTFGGGGGGGGGGAVYSGGGSSSGIGA